LKCQEKFFREIFAKLLVIWYNDYIFNFSRGGNGVNLTTANNKLTEEDVKLRFITPAIDCKWDKHTQIRMEHCFTDGRVIVRGDVVTRGKKKKVDYILSYKSNIPLAIVEAKDNTQSVGAGMQQAIEYAEILDIPFAYSSNGNAFLEHDMKNGTECEIAMEDFPTPDELWRRHIGEMRFTPEQEKLITVPYYYSHGDKTPRYYQRVAINRTIEAVTAFYWLWRQVQARLIQLFRLYIGFGSRGRNGKYYSSPTVIFL